MMPPLSRLQGLRLEVPFLRLRRRGPAGLVLATIEKIDRAAGPLIALLAVLDVAAEALDEVDLLGHVLLCGNAAVNRKEITGAELERLADEIIAGKRRKRKAKPRRTLARDIVEAAKALANRGTSRG